MGIQGLLTFVKPASKSVHLSELKGKTVAIDSYCWIHKGAFGCAEKLGKGEETDAYVQYCFKFIDMLRSFKITPIMVFDGQNLPAKRLTEEKRRESRSLAKKKAAECLRLNKRSEARMNFIKAVDVTPDMALKLIKACRKQNIDCIVAPYEADAQLAYLNQNKIVDFVITEDSDLLVFGCSKVLFKLDLNGNGTLTESVNLFLAMDEKPESFSLDKFRHMCILSGCDYVDSLPGIGLKKALKFIKANSNIDIYDALPKLPSALNLKNIIVSKEYRDNFMIADATFRHQLIFDPLTRELKPLSDPEIYGTKLEFCCNAGAIMENNTAFRLAIGNLSPYNLEILDNWNPDKEISPYAFKPSIWSKSYKKLDHNEREIKTDEIIPSTRDKNVILEIKIPLQEQLICEKYTKKEIESLYFDTETPTKKIRKESPKKSTSPILNRKNIFIKSRFFNEKTLTANNTTKSLNKSDKSSLKIKDQSESDINSSHNLEINLNQSETQLKSKISDESLNKSDKSLIKSENFVFKNDLSENYVNNSHNPKIDLNLSETQVKSAISDEFLNKSDKFVNKSENFVFKTTQISENYVKSSHNLNINSDLNETQVKSKISEESLINSDKYLVKSENFVFKTTQISENYVKTSHNLKTNSDLSETQIKSTLIDKSLIKSDSFSFKNHQLSESDINNVQINCDLSENECDNVNLNSSQKENDKSYISRYFNDEIHENINNDRTDITEIVNFTSSKRTRSFEEKITKLEKQSSIQTRSTTCRRQGLSRKNSNGKFSVQKNQTKLSMFFKTT